MGDITRFMHATERTFQRAVTAQEIKSECNKRNWRRDGRSEVRGPQVVVRLELRLELPHENPLAQDQAHLPVKVIESGERLIEPR